MKEKDEYDSITTILSPFTSLKNIPPDILENAAKRGEVVHKICANICQNLGRFPNEVDLMVREYARNEDHIQKEIEKVNKRVQSFEKWIEKTNPKKIIMPEKMYNDYYMIKGFPDFYYVTQDDRFGLPEIKTPEIKSNTWVLQLTAYAFLARKAGYPIDFIEVLQLDVKGELPNIITYEEDFGLFKSVLNTYRYFYKNKSIEIDASLFF
jgi:hypothetical protein